MPSNINHIMDTVSILTTASAREKLKNHPIEVALYTNVEYKYSIVHSHPYYEIILPLAGQVHYSSGGNVYDLYSGDMILIPAEVYHTFYADSMETPYERIITQV
ncbi:MAG: AraC family ligand binding domain-containing protein, partial [Lachnospiraceae bacterium]|nr:AraC family ligand binding domain-containing protein [Lachnospiraceae bacterium]